MKKYIFNNAHTKLENANNINIELEPYEKYCTLIAVIGMIIFSLNLLIMEFSTTYVLHLFEVIKSHSITNFLYEFNLQLTFSIFGIVEENEYVVKEQTVKFVCFFLVAFYELICLAGYTIVNSNKSGTASDCK